MGQKKNLNEDLSLREIVWSNRANPVMCEIRAYNGNDCIKCYFPWVDMIKFLTSLISEHLSQLIRKYL